MTREPLPRFDLYDELEVASSASTAVIEAAYRILVKDHHPDVSQPADADRIKRLNVAREWLTDPERRRRYDDANRGGERADATPPRRRPATASRAADAVSGASPFETEAPERGSFGSNAAEVRQFLSDLRTLDEPRAAQILAGRAFAKALGYPAAHRAALAAAERRRHREWLFAREAASVVVRGKLGDSDLTTDVVEVIGDVTGAIAIRDLLPRTEFELLMTPWTWRDPGLSERVRLTGTSRARIAQSAAAPRTDRAPPPEAQPPSPPAPLPEAPREPTREAPADPLPARPSRAAPPIQPASTGRNSGASRRRRTLAVAASAPALVAVVALAALGAVMAAGNRPSAADAPAGTVGPGGPAATRLAEVPPVTSPPTSAPTLPPTRALDPVQLRQSQLAVLLTIRELRAAARSSDVEAAQAYLGHTAPNLQPSGLRRATFADVASTDIQVEATADGWLATAGEDTLVSSDGSNWTFDYADRPLAHLGRGPEHTLYWLVGDGRRELDLRVASVSVSRSGITIRFTWGTSPADAAYFDRARLSVSAVSLRSRTLPISAGAFAILDAAEANATIHVSGAARLRSPLVISVAVQPRSGGTGDTAAVVESTFEVTAR